MTERLAARIQLDLDWMASAPPLMSAAYWQAHSLQLAPPPASAKLDPQQLESLEQWLMEHRSRFKVGRWFERVHDTLLAAQPKVHLLAHQRPLRDAGQTLGELDALYRYQDQVVHREIAVKFYLAVRDSDDPAAWWGPSKRDRLDLKLERLTQHQLRLPQIADAAWPEALPVPTRSEALMRGALFRRPGSTAIPHGCHPKVTLGHWYKAAEFESEHRRLAPWVHLEKPWWLSPAQVQHAPPLPDPLPEYPVLAGHMTPEGPKRAFIVPEGWWPQAVGDG